MGCASARDKASENVRPLMAIDGMATRQPNHWLLSDAPTRIVPRLVPLGRCEIDGTGAGFCVEAADCAVARVRGFGVASASRSPSRYCTPAKKWPTNAGSINVSGIWPSDE